MLKNYKIALQVLLTIFIFNDFLFAEVQSQDLIKDAHYLNNTDPDLKNLDNWFALEKKFSNSKEITFEKISNQNSEIILTYSNLLEKISLKTQNLDYAIKALKLLQRITKSKEINSDVKARGFINKGELFWLLGFQDDATRNYRSATIFAKRKGLFDLAKKRLNNPDSILANEEEYIQSKINLRNDNSKDVIVLDPGHGGEDSGAVGVQNQLEKEYVLDVALRLKGKLEEKGFEVVLTRDEDRFVPLATRTKIANEVNAKYFISLHANASPQKNLSGLESYYLDNTNDEATRLLLERENGVSLNDQSDDLSFILGDLVQNAKLKTSVKLAHNIEQEILKNTAQYKLASHGVKKAPFYVLVGAKMPCVLVEMFFIDNLKDGNIIKDSNFRENLADGIAAGVAQNNLKLK